MKFFSLFYQGDVHPADGTKRIPKEEISTLLSAAEVLTRAQEDAQKYQEEVKKECELLKQQAKEEGFAEGLEVFNRHLIHFDKQLSSLKLELQKQILPLALRAAKKLLPNS